MFKNAIRTGAYAAAFVSLTALTACDRHPHDGGHPLLGKVEILDRAQTGRPVVATWTHTGGWEGALPEISLSATQPRISLGARMYSQDGTERPFDTGEYSVRYYVPSSAPQGVLNTNEALGLFHGDHVHLYGQSAGTTQVRFVLWHVNHDDGETGSIAVHVVE
jgi:hypothetical protein